jgi:hypothetical protein
MAGTGSRGRWLVLGVVVVVCLLAAASGEAAKTPGVAWSSSNYEYGTLDAAQGDTASQTFTLRNSDGKPTGTISVGLSGSAFTITGNTCDGKRLSKKTTCMVTVEYAPTANGDDSATLTASAPNTTGANVDLSGESAWQTDDLSTYTQSEWGGDSPFTTAQTLLESDFTTVYVSTFGTLTIGGGFDMNFGSASAIETYLPQTGPADPLDASLSDPSTSASGVFGGDVLTLQLNADFSQAGLVTANSGRKLDGLTICSSGVSALDGQTVGQLLTAVNTLLGGGTSTDGSIATLDPIVNDINNGFTDGAPSTWAQLHLQPGACP